MERKDCSDWFLTRSLERLLLDELNERVSRHVDAAVDALGAVIEERHPVDMPGLVGGVRSRLASLGALHRVLRGRFADPIDLTSLTTELCSVWGPSDPHQRRVRVSISGSAVMLPPSAAQAVAVILTELLGNAVNHAFVDRGGHVRIVHGPFGEGFLLSVSDDGMGPTVSQGPGRGLALVDALATGLGGKFAIRFSPFGTTAQLSVPALDWERRDVA